MRVRIKEWEINIEGTVEEVISLIETKINEEDSLLNSMIIDGVEIFENFESYLNEYWQKIQEIEVVSFTKEEVSSYFLEQIKTEKDLICKKAELLSDCFYGQAQTKEDWNNLLEVLEQGYTLLQLSEDLNRTQSGNTSLIDYDVIADIREKIGLFNEAIEMKDSTYIADLLHFELATGVRKIVG